MDCAAGTGGEEGAFWGEARLELCEDGGGEGGEEEEEEGGDAHCCCCGGGGLEGAGLVRERYEAVNGDALEEKERTKRSGKPKI